MFGQILKQFASPSALARAGVLSMNRRNHDYIMKYNARRYYPMVDDKLLTKTLAAKAGVPVATLIGAIRYQYEVKNVENMIRSCPGGFVITPGHGSGGRGILVVHRHSEGRFEKNDGTVLDRIQVYRVITDILSGLYSLGGQVDYALLEECIDFSDVFRDYSFQGIPDVRVIVFRGYPVMAMIRLATKQSDGRANLHQGAVGIGLSIRDGTPRMAVQFNQPISRHPDTGADLSELRVPFWKEHLELAARCADMIKLGYFGADIVIDRKRGPLLLELNARPVLAIQIANHAGLASRLELMERLAPGTHATAEERVAFAREQFS